MTLWKRTLTAAALAVMALGTSAEAQTVRVQVLDSATSRPMRALEMVVLNEQGDTVATPKANSEGRFVFNAPPGKYTIRCRCIGHKPTELTFDVDGNEELVVRMAPVVVPPEEAALRNCREE